MIQCTPLEVICTPLNRVLHPPKGRFGRFCTPPVEEFAPPESQVSWPNSVTSMSLPPNRNAYENIATSIRAYISLTQLSYFSSTSRCSSVRVLLRASRFRPMSVSRSLISRLCSLLSSCGFIFPYQKSSSMFIAHLRHKNNCRIAEITPRDTAVFLLLLVRL